MVSLWRDYQVQNRSASKVNSTEFDRAIKFAFQLLSHSLRTASFGLMINIFDGEFDPGSGRTLAAWIRHASRAISHLRVVDSGERVSNT